MIDSVKTRAGAGVLRDGEAAGGVATAVFRGAGAAVGGGWTVLATEGGGEV